MVAAPQEFPSRDRRKRLSNVSRDTKLIRQRLAFCLHAPRQQYQSGYEGERGQRYWDTDGLIVRDAGSD